ncbi:MAG TPA: GNAT family N-acetyltransferase [Acidimicrobiales bacterium]
MEGARHATADDVARLAELARGAAEELRPLRGGDLFVNREARREPFEDGFSSELASGEHILLCGTVDDVVIGYASGRAEDLPDGRRLGVIDDLFVEAEARAVGVGERMMDELLAWFRTRGCVGVDAIALPGARETKNFFEESGFSARLLVMHHRLDR